MTARRTFMIVATVGGLVTVDVAPATAAGATVGGVTTRVSVSTGGAQSDGESLGGTLSKDGRFVAFSSTASTLVAGDTNATSDVFVRDLRRSTTTRVSVATGGGQADQEASQPSISADGRYLAFSSHATNLVPGDTNDRGDIFVRDRRAGTTTRVSVTSSGGQAGNTSLEPALSTDGRYVAFVSHATDLVPGDTNGIEDVFVHDRRTGVTQRANISGTGEQANERSGSPAVTADGRYVAFGSFASNLVPDGSTAAGVFIRDLRQATTVRASLTNAGAPADGVTPIGILSDDGRYAAFSTGASDVVAGDTNAVQDVFVRDLRAGSTSRVSVPNSGGQSNDGAFNPTISANGRYVAFLSYASNLVPRDDNDVADVFVRDRWAGVTRRVSVANNEAEGNSPADGGAVSPDGSRVAFTSFASNLVPGDTNGFLDVFVRSYWQ